MNLFNSAMIYCILAIKAAYRNQEVEQNRAIRMDELQRETPQGDSAVDLSGDDAAATVAARFERGGERRDLGSVSLNSEDYVDLFAGTEHGMMGRPPLS